MIEFAVEVEGKHFITGELSAEGSDTFHSLNPRTGEESAATFYNATSNEIDRAVAAAAEAYKETRDYPPSKLAVFLEAVADELDAVDEPFYETTDIETALGLPRLHGEMARTTGQLRKFADLLREGSYVQALLDVSETYDIRRMLIPIGAVAVFSASNFPYAFGVPGGDTASAWAAGCPVVAKGHPSHPATSELFARIINQVIVEQGFPRGFFSMIQSNSIDAGQALVKHPQIAAVGFTGSLRGGRAIFDVAAARPNPIPVFAEMGSINPLVVLPGALQERADDLANGLVGSLTLGTGQFCTNPGLVFVPDTDDGKSFIQSVADLMDASDVGVLLNPQIQAGLANAVSKTLADETVNRITNREIGSGAACQFAPTVLTTTSDVFRKNSSLQREHFGPVVLFVAYNSTDDLIETISGIHGQLAAGIHASDGEIDEARIVYSALKEIAGRLIWNGFPTGVVVVAAMQHGGPYPATTAPATTSVGMTAIERFMRPVAYQSVPDALLPDALKGVNPLGILRKVNNEYTRASI